MKLTRAVAAKTPLALINMSPEDHRSAAAMFREYANRKRNTVLNLGDRMPPASIATINEEIRVFFIASEVFEWTAGLGGGVGATELRELRDLRARNLELEERRYDAVKVREKLDRALRQLDGAAEEIKWWKNRIAELFAYFQQRAEEAGIELTDEDFRIYPAPEKPEPLERVPKQKAIKAHEGA
ncbi:MAG: hypothetical protein ACYTG0_12500 [Planctomycetota bacterium]|jgi:hypothetical protein